jgi:SAM-dependent methyltransferase
MSIRYAGSELPSFAVATNWKRYFAATLKPFIAGRVLEVGAGIGSNIPYFAGNSIREWTSLEPDPEQAQRIAARVAAGELPAARVIAGTLERLDPAQRFDTILYIDVLEHIDDDRAELARAARHLAFGGSLIILAPAHPFLLTPLDAAIGRHRRYTGASLSALTPPGCRLDMTFMLDSMGFFASLAHRALLAKSMPTKRQIALWDKVLVTLSRVLDPLTLHRFGKTVVAVWRRAAA